MMSSESETSDYSQTLSEPEEEEMEKEEEDIVRVIIIQSDRTLPGRTFSRR